jgi:ribonuclease T2
LSTFDVACYGPGYEKHEEVINFFETAVRAFGLYPTFNMLAS